ncbi:MAG: hypothetical protein EHM34_00100 [Nitrosopumilales archaeon]|nr:MAG: hypothetical protein EHM34_00100 [Nitrosopumilales archaeon]
MVELYSVKCVLEGKTFEMPEWTVKKHETLLEEMIPYDEKLKSMKITQKDYDRAYRVKMILMSINEVDPKVTESDLSTLHPDDFIELWIAVYNSGKRGVVRKKPSDFQNGEKTPISK